MIDLELGAIIIGAFAFGVFVGAAAGFEGGSDAWRAETVQRGLATYCPTNGEWAWIGECDNDR